MKLLKRFFYVVLAIFLAAFAVAFFLPNEWNVDESIIIKANKENIYTHIANLKDWQNWSAWSQKVDPTCNFTYEGPDVGVGAKQSWDGKKLGKGSLIITKADPSFGIEYDLFFDGCLTANKGKMIFEDVEDGLRLRWIDTGVIDGFLLKRFMVSYINKMVARDFQTGLTALKALVESEAQPQP